MSSLAFDKQGKPFTFHRRAKKLLVRSFRNPSARGTCCQVLGADGQPLYVDRETDYAEFRRAIGQVPGLYRLDQCDEDGELDDAQPAYVSIATARNAQTGEGASDVSPLVIIQQMAAAQAKVMKMVAALRVFVARIAIRNADRDRDRRARNADPGAGLGWRALAPLDSAVESHRDLEKDRADAEKAIPRTGSRRARVAEHSPAEESATQFSRAKSVNVRADRATSPPIKSADLDENARGWTGFARCRAETSHLFLVVAIERRA